MRLSCLTSPWASIAPIPLAAVSTWTKNIFVKSGLCRTGGSHRCCFSCVKARLQSSVQSTGFLTCFGEGQRYAGEVWYEVPVPPN